MAKVAIFQKLADNAALVLNDPWLDSTAADLLYLRLDTTNDPLTGALTVANIAGALNSGAFTLQMDSGVADGATAVAYNLDTANTLANAGAVHTRLSNNGAAVLEYFPDTTGITFAGFGNTVRLDFTGVDNTFGDVILSGVSSLGAYYFENGSNRIAMSPGLSAFQSTSAQLKFATNFPTSNQATAALDDTVAAFFPSGTKALTLGHNSGDAATNKWAGAFFSDGATAVAFGNNADATIGFDGTDLIIDGNANGIRIATVSTETIGVLGAAPVAQQSVTGSRGGNAALASLLTAMATFGWIADNTTA